MRRWRRSCDSFWPTATGGGANKRFPAGATSCEGSLRIVDPGQLLRLCSSICTLRFPYLQSSMLTGGESNIGPAQPRCYYTPVQVFPYCTHHHHHHTSPTLSFQAPRRGISDDGGRQRMLLGAPRHKSPRGRLGCDGRPAADPEQRCSPYPARATKQLCSEVALLSLEGEGEIKGSLKIACSTPICSLAAVS